MEAIPKTWRNQAARLVVGFWRSGESVDLRLELKVDLGVDLKMDLKEDLTLELKVELSVDLKVESFRVISSAGRWLLVHE